MAATGRSRLCHHDRAGQTRPGTLSRNSTAVAGRVLVMKKTVKEVYPHDQGFPHEGILFANVTNLFAMRAAFVWRSTNCCTLCGVGPIDRVAGLEARGFILAGRLRTNCHWGFGADPQEGQTAGQTIAAGVASWKYGRRRPWQFMTMPLARRKGAAGRRSSRHGPATARRAKSPDRSLGAAGVGLAAYCHRPARIWGPQGLEKLGMSVSSPCANSRALTS